MMIDPIEKGQGLLEYALIFVFVVIVVIVLLYLLGPAVSNWYQQIVQSI